MAEVASEIAQVYLQPGEVHVARTPTIVRTVLGSCVGVTFWCMPLGVGALCHGVLPRCPQGVQAAEGYRYVDFAIRHLIQQLEGLGANRSEIQVKLFGGADVLPVQSPKSGKKTVGCLNWHAALEVLRYENLAVMASDLGGSVGRTIQFDTGTGEVLVRRLIQKVEGLL